MKRNAELKKIDAEVSAEQGLPHSGHGRRKMKRKKSKRKMGRK